MHLLFIQNEEDKETGFNKCKYIFITNSDDSLYCPMTRLSTSVYSEKWKNLSKSAEHKLVIVIAYIIFRVKSIQIKKQMLLKDYKLII